MKRLLTSICLLLVVVVCQAAEEDTDLKQLYKQLDAVIDSAGIYEKRKIENIAFLKAQLSKSHQPAYRYQMAYALYSEYESYVCDSALTYIRMRLDIARQMGRKDLTNSGIIDMATQLAKSGFYAEALTHFGRVSTSEINDSLRSNYYWGLGYLYGELAFYTKDQTLKKTYWEKQGLYNDSLMAVIDTHTQRYLLMKMILLNKQGKHKEALAYNNEWLEMLHPTDRDYAMAAVLRSETYKNMGDTNRQRQWLIRSAMADIRNAVMDQAALMSLANSLACEGDTEHSYRYMELSWNCITKFTPHMRSWLITPIVNMIKDQHGQQLTKANNRLMMLVGAISILLLAMAGLYGSVVRKRRQLAKTRDELARSNDSLTSLNENLRELNDQLQDANLHLHDANRIKEQGISQFLKLCSLGVDKMDAFRIMVNRKLRVNQYADLVKVTGSQEMKEKELEFLFANFDRIFLQIFPTFVNDFNALLNPEARINPPKEGGLTTILRIYALIRMGIEDGTDIAAFLRCSPNSVYTYRSRIKRHAVCGHDDFEQFVKEIGLTR